MNSSSYKVLKLYKQKKTLLTCLLQKKSFHYSSACLVFQHTALLHFILAVCILKNTCNKYYFFVLSIMFLFSVGENHRIINSGVQLNPFVFLGHPQFLEYIASNGHLTVSYTYILFLFSHLLILTSCVGSFNHKSKYCLSPTSKLKRWQSKFYHMVYKTTYRRQRISCVQVHL